MVAGLTIKPGDNRSFYGDGVESLRRNYMRYKQQKISSKDEGGSLRLCILPQLVRLRHRLNFSRVHSHPITTLPVHMQLTRIMQVG